MNVRQLVTKVNQTTEELDLVSARKYIEENLAILIENKYQLKCNARALLDFIAIQDKENKALTVLEMNILKSINIYASRFDLRGLRISAKNNSELLLRKDVKYYLNEDAKFLLEGMNAIQKDA